MRALLIGLGGAGCRIVDTLNQHDERSGVRSVRSFVFDADQKTIAEIQSIPTEDRFVLTPLDPVKEHNNHGTDFEVGNLASCFQRNGIEEIDAVFVCAGLGGRMAELVPMVVSQIADAFPDPVFTILTLPGRNEGVRVSARASKTLADIRKISQATILFDNETWFKRTEDEDSIKNLVEAKHKATEAAEVVLDAGEVLNTLTGMDLVSIGYATEKLPTTWTNNVLKRIRVEKYLLEENQARTSRIVELAKQAVYREVSVPCDLTSSEKALILIAGPSDELSMKGFQTVRKWIDRSIKGLEMRAGDYPVKSTRYVGVIIVLAGLENVPRVKELDEIRAIYENEQSKEYEESDKTEKSPKAQIANDELLFEDEMVMPIGVNNRSAVSETEDDIFELDDFTMQGTGDDVFEDEPRRVQYSADEADDVFEEKVSSPSQQRYMYPPQYTPQYVQQTQTATIFDEPLSDDRPVIPKEKPKAKEMPKITIAGPKKQPQMTGSTIMMPKREKKVDNVLAGMADVGGKDKPKDSDSVLSGKTRVGGINRPKETITTDVLEGSVTVGNQRPKETYGGVRMSGGQRPKETMVPGVLEGSVTVGTQRPKETDGHIRMTGSQRPKETDGHIRMANSQRPKETDGVVSGGSTQRPKEIGEYPKVGDVQKPREPNKGIRVTSIPLPKNPAGKTVPKKSERDKWL